MTSDDSGELMLMFMRDSSAMRAMARDARGREELSRWRAVLRATREEQEQHMAQCNEALSLIDATLGRLDA